MIDLGYLAGWMGLAFGIFVPLPQLYKMLKTKKSKDVSLTTYALLWLTMLGYLIHATYIGAVVFVVSNSFNLTTNSIVLIILIKRKLKYG